MISFHNTPSSCTPSFSQDKKKELEILRRQLSPLMFKLVEDELLNDILSGSLEYLSFEGLPINDNDLKILLSHCPKLVNLDLSEATFLTNEGLMASLQSDIRHLSLRGLVNLTEDILPALASLHSLETLDLSQTNFSFQNLCGIDHLTRLKKLFFWQCRKLRDADIAWLKNKNLGHLDISYCTSLTDHCFESLNGVEILDLDGINFITSNGLNCLSSSEHLKKVSIEKCRNIAKSALHPSIQKLL